MADAQAAAKNDTTVVAANVFRKSANIVYGTLEAGVGSFVLFLGVLPAALTVADGARRLYRETPQAVRRFFSLTFTGKEPAAKSIAPKSSLAAAIDVVLAGATAFTGATAAVLGLGVAALAGFAALAAGTTVPGGLLLPALGGAALMAGGLVSLAKNGISFVKNHMFKPNGDVPAATVSAPAAAAAAPALANSQSAPAFNKASEPKQESAVVKSSAPVILPPPA